MEVKRVGTAFGGCSVYYFEELGYWKAPKGISICIYKTRPGVRFISHIPAPTRDPVATMAIDVTPEWVKKQIEFHCTRIEKEYGLYGTISKTIDYYPTVSPIDQYYQFGFAVPEALRTVKGYPFKVRGRSFRTRSEQLKERARMIGVSKRYQQELRDLFRLTKEEATSITETCPTLIKTF